MPKDVKDEQESDSEEEDEIPEGEKHLKDQRAAILMLVAMAVDLLLDLGLCSLAPSDDRGAGNHILLNALVPLYCYIAWSALLIAFFPQCLP